MYPQGRNAATYQARSTDQRQCAAGATRAGIAESRNAQRPAPTRATPSIVRRNETIAYLVHVITERDGLGRPPFPFSSLVWQSNGDDHNTFTTRPVTQAPCFPQADPHLPSMVSLIAPVAGRKRFRYPDSVTTQPPVASNPWLSRCSRGNYGPNGTGHGGSAKLLAPFLRGLTTGVRALNPIGTLGGSRNRDVLSAFRIIGGNRGSVHKSPPFSPVPRHGGAQPQPARHHRARRRRRIGAEYRARHATPAQVLTRKPIRPGSI